MTNTPTTLSEEQRELLKNWKNRKVAAKLLPKDTMVLMDEILLPLLEAKDLEAAEKVQEAVRLEREKCAKIFRTKVYLVECPEDIDEIEKAIFMEPNKQFPKGNDCHCQQDWYIPALCKNGICPHSHCEKCIEESKKVDSWIKKELEVYFMDILEDFKVDNCSILFIIKAIELQAQISKEEGRKEQKEIVICAAVKTDKGQIFRGHRHSDCFGTIRSAGLKISGDPDDQGFITSKNRYVNRREAFKLQQAALILSADLEEGYKGNELYSEDLY